MKSIIILFTLTLLFNNDCNSQPNGKSFSLHGKITGNYNIDSINFQYAISFEDQNNIYTRGKRRISQVSNGSFEIKIDSVEGLVYLQFQNIKNMGILDNPTYGLLSYSPVVVWPGMDLQMEITQDSVLFSGADASIMNCILELRKLTKKSDDSLQQSFDKYEIVHGEGKGPYKRMWSYLVEYHDLINASLEQGKVVFDNYSKSRQENAWQQVWYDWLGESRYYQINKLHFYYNQYSRNYKLAIEDFYKKYIMCIDDTQLIANYDGSSSMFPKYLYYKSKSDLIFLLAGTGADLYPSFDMLLDLITARYKEDLFDQVAFSAILIMGATKVVDESTYIKLISFLRNSEYKKSVEDMLVRRTRNRLGYQFALEDIDGNILTPKDFAGKTVIMDFWYTGCPGCKVLYQHMKPIKNTFLADSNVVILSVNVDNTKAIWQETLSDQTNGYTDSTHVNVWLESSRKKANPMLRYYDIYSYPTLIILNGDNEIQAYNPAYKSAFEKKSLIDIIDRSLKEKERF